MIQHVLHSKSGIFTPDIFAVNPQRIFIILLELCQVLIELENCQYFTIPIVANKVDYYLLKCDCGYTLKTNK